MSACGSSDVVDIWIHEHSLALIIAACVLLYAYVVVGANWGRKVFKRTPRTVFPPPVDPPAEKAAPLPVAKVVQR